MKYITLIPIFLLFCLTILKAQPQDIWFAFRDKNTSHIGFKDANGHIKIEPKFMGMTVAQKFDKIIGVMEEHNGYYTSYYLLKSGKKIAYDSLYTFDYRFDCESEGFICFYDKKNDKVGVLNSQGEVTIPAEYDYMSPITNGVSIVLKNAKKKHWNEEKDDGCDHYSWEGGQTMLIDTTNNIIIKNFEHNGYLDLFSLKTHNKPSESPFKKSFLGTDNKYYSFIDLSKNLEYWIQDTLLTQLSPSTLIAHSFPNIYFYSTQKGVMKSPCEVFIKRNFSLIYSQLNMLKNDTTDYFITTLSAYPFDSKNPEYEKYFNNCGDAKESQYPLLSLVVNHEKGKKNYQDHFDFLKTDEGYQLISVSIDGKKLN